MTARHKPDALTIFAAANIAVAIAVTGMKYLAYQATGSVALYSDALESVVNVITAIAALAAIRLGAKPPDADHPFGHHKAEFLAAVFEGAVIFAAAILIAVKSYSALLTHAVLQMPATGIGISIVASLINALWAWLVISRARKWRSPALEADGWHLVTDVVTSVGVVSGLGVALASGWSVLDPLIAAAVALHILWMGFRIASQSASRLLDQAAGPDIQSRIRRAIEANGHGALEAHDIRTREAGRALFIEFHLVVPGTMTVEYAHAICDRLETAIEAEIEGSEVVIHVEPGHKRKPNEHGAVVLSAE